MVYSMNLHTKKSMCAKKNNNNNSKKKCISVAWLCTLMYL